MVVPAAFFHALFFKPNDKMKSQSYRKYPSDIRKKRLF